MKREAISAMYGSQMEQLVAEIFANAGYQIEQGVELSLNSINYRFDIIAAKGSTKLAIEVKSFRMNRVASGIIMNAIERLLTLVASSGEAYIPVLAVVGYVPPKLHSIIDERFHAKVVVVDIQQLLFMVQYNQVLRDKLVSALEYSVDNIVPTPPQLDIHCDPQQPAVSEYDLLIQRLDSWDPKNTTSSAYERLCTDILIKVLADDLTLWREQQKSDADLFRFDLICKIKNGTTKEFWNMCERYFNSKYIVFEYKNYCDKISQKEIFTTVKYLYMKALRGVAIIVSVNGTNDHADWAIRGILREEGKLIISLSNADLCEMIERKKRGEDPAEYLCEKLDALLIDLEK